MRLLICISFILLTLTGCALIKLPVKAAKTTVKAGVKGVELAGKGVKAVVD